MQRRKFSREFKVEAVKLIKDRGVSVAQAGRDLGVHENVLRKWVKEFGSDPVQAFPGHGQMKPEQLEIERLRREVNKLKAERDILKNCPGPLRACAGHEVRLHREAPDYLAGGMAMRSNGRIPVGLPCLAEPIAQRQISKRRSGRPKGEGQLRCQRPDLRRTAGLARPAGRRRRMRSAPDRAGDAPAGLAGAATPPASAQGRRRSPDYNRAIESSGSAVCGRAAEPEVDCRLHLHLDRRGLALRVGRDRPVLAPGGRLVDERQHDGPVGCRCTADGGLAARQAQRVAAPFRSRQPGRI